MDALLHHALLNHAARTPSAAALAQAHNSAQGQTHTRLDYAALAGAVEATAAVLIEAGLQRGQRVAVYLEKRPEAVSAMFGAAAAGGVFVPVNPLLRAEQVEYILKDCNVSVLVTSSARLAALEPVLDNCRDLRCILLVDDVGESVLDGIAIASLPRFLRAAPARKAHRVIDQDLAAILYTSGSTGKPKGVVLSHRNLVCGADSVRAYLKNTASDRILAALPLSFDYGLSQLTTAFASGACAVLLNYLGPRDIVETVAAEGITGLAGVPPLWLQLAQQSWPAANTLRYLTNSGGVMPRAVLDRLRAALPRAEIFLMYGLTEAFRSTYLPPEELDRRPDSIGIAIPNAEVMVLREDGSECAADEAGELVHRGAQVAQGYWNDAEKTAARFRPWPVAPGLAGGEMAVWSGDTVRRDAEGFLYFVARHDEMMKVSGYRISPTEVEEVLNAHLQVAEAVVFGVPDGAAGDAVIAIVAAREGQPLSVSALRETCRRRLPGYMVPADIELWKGALPRTPNGKFDRQALRQWYLGARANPADANADAEDVEAEGMELGGGA